MTDELDLAIPQVNELLKPYGLMVVKEDAIAAARAEAQSEIARLQAEVERLTGERRMIVSHATMGATDGSGMNVNAVSCEITKLRNDLYDEGITRARCP